MEAVERYGALRGGLMAVWRVLRCHPFARGGYDPVVRRGEGAVVETPRRTVMVQGNTRSLDAHDLPLRGKTAPLGMTRVN